MKKPDSSSNPKLDQMLPADPGSEVPGTPMEESLQIFWEKNRNAIYVLCVLVLAGIMAKGGWEYFTAQKKADLGRAYATASTPEMLKSFASTHADLALGGAAELRLADAAYAEEHADEAVSRYQKAVAELPAGPFVARAKLGLAMAEIQAGRMADGEAGLRQLSGDASQLAAVRAEAAYQLASLAAAQNRAEDVKRLAEQIMQIDPQSPWVQRAFMLEMSHPAPATAAPAIQLGKK